MTYQQDNDKSSALRNCAEQKLRQSRIDTANFSLEDARNLIHELNVHQIELELQNEELRLTQLDLETARRKYVDLYEFSPIGLLTLDNNECIQETNLKFVTLMGTDRETLVRRNLSEFIDPSAQDTYHFFYQALHRTQQPQQCEIILLPINQPPMVVRLDATILMHADNYTTYRIAVSDITERHQSELEIRRLYAAEQEARSIAVYTARQLASLQQITAALSRAISYEQVSDACLQQSIAIIGAQWGVILLLSSDGSTLLSGGFYGGAERAESPSFASTAPFIEALRLQKPVFIQSLEAYIQRYPQSSDLPVDDSQAFANLPLILNEQPIGILSYSFSEAQCFTEEDQLFMQALAHQCAQALERMRLSDQARDIAALQERQRLGHDLHDSVKQSLFAATSMSEALPRLWERNPERARMILAQVITLNRAALAQMQGILFELLPASILKTPLSVLLRQLSETVGGHREMAAELEIEGGEPMLPDDVHIAIYRIAQESLNNIVKHSQATHLIIHLLNELDQLTLSIRDNGVGFDVTDSLAGMGLSIMQERAAAIHAILNITSSAGVGTELKLLWKPLSVVLTNQ